jgi:hypothetical protein
VSASRTDTFNVLEALSNLTDRVQALETGRRSKAEIARENRKTTSQRILLHMFGVMAKVSYGENEGPYAIAAALIADAKAKRIPLDATQETIALRLKEAFRSPDHIGDTHG